MYNHIKADELITYGDSNLMGGGYTASTILNTSLNLPNQTGGTNASLFDHLAVPAGLLLTQSGGKSPYFQKENMELMSDTLYERLIHNLSQKPNITGGKRKTKKNKKHSNKQTKKQTKKQEKN